MCWTLPPLCGVPRLRFADLDRQLIDEAVHVCIGILVPSQLLITIHPLLPKIDVREQFSPPRIIEEIGSAVRGRRSPDSRIRVATVGRSKSAVKIPDWSERQLPIPRFIKVSAEA